jgi:hypothetical protein
MTLHSDPMREHSQRAEARASRSFIQPVRPATAVAATIVAAGARRPAMWQFLAPALLAASGAAALFQASNRGGE